MDMLQPGQIKTLKGQGGKGLDPGSMETHQNSKEANMNGWLQT
jgi:hypothetical protein